MAHFHSASTGPSSLESTEPYCFGYPPSTPKDAFDGREIAFNNIPNDPRDPWSYTSGYRQPGLTSALSSSDVYNDGHDFLGANDKTTNHISGFTSQGLSMQPQHTDQWRMVQSEDTLCPSSPPKAPDNTAFCFRNMEEDDGVAPLGFGLANHFARSPPGELREGVFAGQAEIQRHGSSAGLFTRHFDTESGPRPQEKVASSGQESDGILFPLEWNISSESFGRTHRNAETTSIRDCLPGGHEFNQSNVKAVSIPSALLLEESHEVFDRTTNWAPQSPLDISPLDISRSASHSSFGFPAQPPQPSNDGLPRKSTGGAFDIPIICQNCSTQNTPLWRRGVDGLPMCNACGLFLRLHGTNRPLSLKTDVIKKRNRTPNVKSPVSPGATSTRAAKRPGSVSRILSSDSIASSGSHANKRKRSVAKHAEFDYPQDVNGYHASDVSMPG